MPEVLEQIDVTLIEKGTRAMSELDARMEKAEQTKRKAVIKLDNATSTLESQVTRLVRTLFNTDRNMAKALRKMQKIREKQEASGEPTTDFFSFAGTNFSLEQIDPKAVIEQRELTGQEKAILKDIDGSVMEIQRAASEVIAVLNAELFLLGSYLTTVEALSQNLKRIVISSPGQRGKLAVSEFDQVRQRLNKARAIEADLKTLRKRAIKVQTMAKRVHKIISGTNSRSDIEDVLFVIGGGGALLAVAAGLVFGSMAAGIVALPALLAFGASKAVKIFNSLRGA